MAKSPAPSTQTLGHYALRRKLGAGAMGQVWLAHDKLLDREVAIKILNAGMSDKRLVQDFLREAQAAAKLNHPNTVTIYQIGKHGDKVYIAMEYVEAGSLSDELRDKGALPWREATQAIRDAAAGLQAAHERGMVHRDIKPSNLMRSARGLVKVVDFGLAKARTSDTEATQTVAGTILGSPAYMSPEQCRGERADARSDLYSLICSYYQLLTRQTPFVASELTAAMYQHCHEPFPDVRAKGMKVPDGIVRILEKGSLKNREYRYQTAAELIADLDTVLHTPEVSHTFDGKVTRSGATRTAQPIAADSPPNGKSVLPKAISVFIVAAIVGLTISWQIHLHRHAASVTGGLAEKSSDAGPRPVIAATPRVVDVLKLIDIDRDNLKGDWKRVGGGLASAGNRSLLQVPYRTPAEYDFTVVFSPGDDRGHGMSLILSKGQRLFLFTISAEQYWDAFALVKGMNGDKRENPTSVPSAVRPVQGQKYTIEVRVRNDHVEAFLSGRPVTRYKTDYTDLSNFDQFDRVQPGTLGLMTWDSPATIYSAQVTEVTGSGTIGLANRVVDLMPLIDVNKDAFGGQWKVDPSGLICDATPSASGRMRIGYKPPEEYALKVEFTRVSGNDAVVLILNHGRSFAWEMGTGKNTVDAFSMVDNLPDYHNSTAVHSQASLENGKRYKCVVLIRPHVVAAYLDGQTLSRLETDYSNLSLGEARLGSGNFLGIGCNGSKTIFHKIELEEITGAGKPFARAIDLMPLINPTTDAMVGTWHMNGGKLQVDTKDSTHVSLRLPYTPADDEEYDLAVRFTFRTGGSTGVHALLSHGGRRFNLMLNQDGTYGLENVGGKSARVNTTSGRLPGKLDVGVQHEFVILVHSTSVTVLLDGKQLLYHPTDYSDLDENEHWHRSDNSLGVGSWLGGVEFGTIDVKEISGYGTVRAASAVSPGNADASVSSIVRTDATGHRIVDLMPLIDPKADAIRGSWTMVGGKLRDDHNQKTLLRLPYLPGDSEEYDFHVGFVLRQGGEVVHGLATYAGTRFGVVADNAYGLENVGGSDAYTNSTSHNSTGNLTRDVQHDLVIRVRAAQVDVCLDGRRVINYSKGYDKLSENENWKRPDGALGIGAGWGDVDYGPIEVIEVKGTGTLLRAPIPTQAPATSSPTGEDPHRTTAGLLRTFTTIGNLWSARVAPGGRRLCFHTTHVFPHEANVVDVETGKKVRSSESDFVELLPDGKRFVIDSDRRWRIGDIETGKDLFVLQPVTWSNAAISHDGSRMMTFAATPQDDPILYDLSTGAKICELQDHGTVNPRALTPDGRLFAAETTDDQLHVWDAEKGNELWRVAVVHGRGQLDFSADGKRLLRRSPNAGAPVDLFNAKTGELLAHCGGWSGRCNDSAIRADGKFLVAGCDDSVNGLRLFKLDGDEKKLTSTVMDWPAGAKEIGQVSSVAFSDDNHRVLVGCRNGKVRLYDVRQGNELAEFDHGGEVLQVSYCSDGRYAVSGNDTTIRVWRLP